jgi:CheY-like chemotaxis protein
VRIGRLDAALEPRIGPIRALKRRLHPDDALSWMALPPTPRMLVLYIDDSYVDLQQAKDVLEADGFEVLGHTSPATAERDLPGADVVLIDYHMPGAHGGEVVTRLRQLVPAGQHTYFYLYTSDRTLSGEYRRLGFDGQVILKGNPEALLRQMDAARRAVALRRLRPAG